MAETFLSVRLICDVASDGDLPAFDLPHEPWETALLALANPPVLSVFFDCGFCEKSGI